MAAEQTFSFTRQQLADAFERWTADSPKDSDGRFTDPAGPGEQNAETLLRYLAAID